MATVLSEEPQAAEETFVKILLPHLGVGFKLFGHLKAVPGCAFRNSDLPGQGVKLLPKFNNLALLPELSDP